MEAYATPPRTRRGRHRSGKRATRRRSATPTSHCWLIVDKKKLAFDQSVHSVTFTVRWNVKPPVNLLDWIGLYELGESNPLNYLDYRSVGVCGRCPTGVASWVLSRRTFHNCCPSEVTVTLLKSGRMFLKRGTSADLLVDLKYFDGPSGKIRATTAPLRVSLWDGDLNEPSDPRSPFRRSSLDVETQTTMPSSSSTSSSSSIGDTPLCSTSRTVTVGSRQQLWLCDEDGVAERLLEELPVLPSGYEARVDVEGRVFFVNHERKVTSWTLEKATSIRRQSPPPMSQRSVIQQRAIRTNRLERLPHSTPERSLERADTEQQALRFILRPDFFQLLQSNKRAKEIYQSNPAVKQLVQRLRKDSLGWSKYCRHSDLVGLLNAFVDDTLPLPTGWQILFDVDSRKPFFADQRSRRTTIFDPRLSDYFAVLQEESQGSSNSDHDRAAVRCLRRLTERGTKEEELFHRAMPELNFEKSTLGDKRLRKKLNDIRKHGLAAYRQHKGDLDVSTLLSILEGDDEPIDRKLESIADEEVVPSIDDKAADFFGFLRRVGFGQGPGIFKLRLRRDELLADSFEQILGANKRVLQRCRLAVEFVGEDALDYGGPSREFFYLVSRQLFNPYYGLFEYSAGDNYNVQINPNSLLAANYAQWFQFCGRLLALALMHGHLIDVFFTRPLYKLLLKRPLDLTDVTTVDSQFYASLLWLRENQVTDELNLTFSVNEVVDATLVPGGESIGVTEENKMDYLEKLVKWRLQRGIQRQTDHLINGFSEVLGDLGWSAVQRFEPSELELVMSGSVEVDLDDWIDNTVYKGGYSADSVVVRWFWLTVRRLSNAQRLQLLQFVTGSSTIPYEGLAALRGSSGERRRFTIQRWGDEGQLPRAHCCFNRIDLPPYSRG